jgi:hypothetical protein
MIIKAESLSILEWWVEASYAIHGKRRGHTGVTLYMGKVSIMGIWKKQKINTRSSTESELVGSHDLAPQMIWARYFIEAQGYKLEESALNQDNMSAMLLEMNWKESSSNMTKHINVRYFFIKDLIKSGDITLKHCPRNGMRVGAFYQASPGKSIPQVWMH